MTSFFESYVKKILGIDDIATIVKDRQDQLQQQDKIDIHLRKLNHSCPLLVSEYLLCHRHNNRRMTSEYKVELSINPISMINGYISTSKKQLEIVKQQQDELLKALDSDQGHLKLQEIFVKCQQQNNY